MMNFLSRTLKSEFPTASSKPKFPPFLGLELALLFLSLFVFYCEKIAPRPKLSAHCFGFAGVAQLVERYLPKVNVVSSSLITRYRKIEEARA